MCYYAADMCLFIRLQVYDLAMIAKTTRITWCDASTSFFNQTLPILNTKTTAYQGASLQVQVKNKLMKGLDKNGRKSILDGIILNPAPYGI